MIRTEKQIAAFRKLIIALSVMIPLVVALLFGIKIEGADTSILPHIYVIINGLTATILIFALIAILNNKVQLHQNLITSAMICSLTFLILYVIYHMTNDSTRHEGSGISKQIYYFILISHIILSIGVVPLVLFSYFRAWKGDFEAHKKLTRYAYPIWLYVAISGVVVYLMISPYY